MDDVSLRNFGTQISVEDEQSLFNFWIVSQAYAKKCSVADILETAIVKQEEMSYTGEMYDFSK